MIVSKVLFDNFKKLLYNIYVTRKKRNFLMITSLRGNLNTGETDDIWDCWWN